MTGKNLTTSGLSSDLVLSDTASDSLEKIELSEEKYAEIIASTGSKTLGGKIPFLGILLEGVQKITAEIREEKLKILLNRFEKRFNSTEEALGQFKILFQSRPGVVLFQKIVHILDDGAEDREWINLLSGVLKNVVDNDIEKQFEELSYVLAQISKLSPQALIVLSKKEYWQTYKFTGSTTMSKQKIVGDWDTQIVKHFASAISVIDKNKIVRMAHTFRELESSRMIFIDVNSKLACTKVGELVRISIS